MRHSYKVLINIFSTFSRVVINTLATLVATRIALRVLGASDFGLYNLLAGTVAMLSFINGALTVSAQRFFSIAIGSKEYDKLNRYYNASLSIHFLLGCFIVLLLLSFRGFLFDHVLNIESYQVEIGKSIYNIMVISSAITLLTIPFSAIMNAHEDLVMMAIADIVSCLIKLVAALILLLIEDNLLIIYSVIILGATLSKALIEFAWSKIKYQEVSHHISRLTDTHLMAEMLGFIGWNTLGSFAVVFRNQGMAIVLNVFFGTVINAAYGIANQVNSLVLSFATSLTAVFSPVIIQAKGSGNEERMRSVSVFSSKLSFFLSSAFALPILIFLDYILSIWLGHYPDGTGVFCHFVVLSFLVVQLYPGINRAIYASGHIRGYQIALSILLILILPIGSFLFKLGLPPVSIIIIMFISQIGTLITTIHYAVRFCGFDTWDLCKNIAIKPFSCFLFFFVLFNALKKLPLFSLIGANSQGISLLLLVLFSLVILIIYAPVYFFAVLNNNEQALITQMIKSMLNKRMK